MKISEKNKKKLLREIKFVIDRMKEEKDPKSKLYYFTAIYGAMSRVFNEEFIPDLIFAHVILNAVYSNLISRIDNPDDVIKLPENIFNKLQTTTEELYNTIEKNKDLYEPLKKFSLLTFVTTGNGYYLYKKGLLKI